MRTGYYISVALFVLAFGIALQAQNISADFTKINQTYTNHEKLSMDISYVVYPSHNSSSPVDRQKGVYRKNGKDYCNSLMGVETIVEDKKMVTVNHNIKKVVLAPARELNAADISGINMQEALKNYEKTDYVDKGAGTGAYIVYLKKGGLLERYELHFSKNTWLIEKIILFYSVEMDLSEDGSGSASKPRLEISYNNIQTNPAFEKDDFKISRYVSMGSKPVLTNTYKNYNLLQTK